ncbi:ECF RNA polymerase sigma factor SigH [Shimia sp. SK013]|uniref:sigma-70 family RNA polymerase sigma factor n=1 Tax=Shimia sp. SK013 TaxID=1389006 RepID=UPI0006B46654|nr:sigma-70 family RNA polymerase sigma factor [Shimia sp. SK013]KPA20655.1 ECF RNA polymerase sigma factor SigH [Shimia sp. SK013]
MSTAPDLTAVWSAYRDRLKAFLHARIANPADVDDLLQDISIKAFTGLPDLQDHAKLKPWLFQTANRAIIDHYRANARGKDIDPGDLWYVEDDPVVRHDLEGCVTPFINALPADTAQMLTEIDLNGMSQRDYAQAHDIPYSTLKSRVTKARTDLRDLFEGCCKFTMDSRGNLSEMERKSTGCSRC